MALPKKLDHIDEKLDRILANQDRILAILEPPATPTDGELADILTPDADPAALFAASIDYETYSAQEIIDRAPSLSAEERGLLHDYENANKARKTVLEALAA